MKRRTLLNCATIIALLLLLVGCGNRSLQDAAASGTAVAPYGAPVMAGTGEEAYDFSLERLDGGTLTLSDLRGKWVLVNFWATWCPPCVKEMPYLNELAASREIEVIGVNMNETRAKVADFVDETGTSFPILLNPDEDVKIMYEARALPRTVIVAPDGTIAGRILGAVSAEGLETWLDEHDIPRRQGS
ncbi:MAG: TlpA family protein disulfide reductase [Caldilineaceae bacterium]